MGAEIRLPSINGATAQEQVSQIKSYLYQLVEQLQYAFEHTAPSSSGGASVSVHEIEAQLVHSSRLLQALYSEISTRLSGKYVAQKDFETSVKTALKEIGDGLSWMSLGLSDTVSESDVGVGRTETGCFYRTDTLERHVHIAFRCAFTYTGGAVTVNASAIPEAYRPKWDIYAVCAADGVLARVKVDSEGIVSVESLITTSDITTPYEVSWIDGYIDYFKEDEYVY